MDLRLRPVLPLALLLALVCARFAAPAGAQGVPAPVVAAVELAGLTHVPESTVREALKLKPGEPFTAQQLEADRKAVLGLGYFRSVAAQQQMDAGKAKVTFRVVEWPVVVYVRILGNTVVETSDIRTAITTHVGQVLCAPQLQNDVRAIERLYRQHGYVARISDKLLDEATKSGILRFEVLEIAIQDLQIEGGTDRQQRRAREVLAELPGDLYQPERVADDQKRLLKIKGIDRVAVKVEATTPGKVRVRWLLNPPEGTPDQMGMPASG